MSDEQVITRYLKDVVTQERVVSLCGAARKMVDVAVENFPDETDPDELFAYHIRQGLKFFAAKMFTPTAKRPKPELRKVLKGDPADLY